MAKTKWYPTGVRGIRFRKHPSRKHGVRFDRYYTIRFQASGERIEEGLGWESEDWTLEKSVSELHMLKMAIKTGAGPARMAEKRELAEEAKDEKAKAEQQAITFGSFVEKHYLPLQVGNKSWRSLDREKSLFRKWINPVLAETLLKEVSQIQLERIKSNMANGKAPPPKSKSARKRPKKMSPRSIHYFLAVVRQVFNTAARLGYFDGTNPIKTIKAPKYDNRRLRFLSHEEAEALLGEIKKRSQQTHDIALLSLHCGLRAGEIFDLQWGQLDLKQGIVNVLDTKSEYNRHIYMTDTVRQMFEAYDRGKPTVRVFPSRKGGRINEISNAFHRSVDKLGLNNGIEDRRQKVTFHTMRHTYASWSVMCGVSLFELQKLLGHADYKMVQRYAHLAPEHLQGARDKFQNAFSSSQRNLGGKTKVK